MCLQFYFIPCPVDIDTAEGYLMGTLTDAEVAAIELHKLACVSCRDLLEDAAALLTEMRECSAILLP